MRIEKLSYLRIVLNNVKKLEKSVGFLIDWCAFVLVLTYTSFLQKIRKSESV